MEYKTYMAEDGTIHSRPVMRSMPSTVSRHIKQSVSRVLGQEQQTMTLSGKILTGIMMLVCAIGMVLFIDLKGFYSFYKGSGFALFLLWTLPVIISILYSIVHIKTGSNNKIIDAWFCASMVTLFQSLLIWQGAGSYLGALAGWILIAIISILFLILFVEETNILSILKGVTVASYCVFFIPCVIISGSLCGGNMNRISGLNGFLKFIAVFPAFVEIGIAITITIKGIMDRR